MFSKPFIGFQNASHELKLAPNEDSYGLKLAEGATSSYNSYSFKVQVKCTEHFSFLIRGEIRGENTRRSVAIRTGDHYDQCYLVLGFYFPVDHIRSSQDEYDQN